MAPSKSMVHLVSFNRTRVLLFLHILSQFSVVIVRPRKLLSSVTVRGEGISFTAPILAGSGFIPSFET